MKNLFIVGSVCGILSVALWGGSWIHSYKFTWIERFIRTPNPKLEALETAAAREERKNKEEKTTANSKGQKLRVINFIK